MPKKRGVMDKLTEELEGNEKDMIEEVNEKDGSKSFRAKGGGFAFKGKDAKKKAMEQARKMKSKK